MQLARSAASNRRSSIPAPGIAKPQGAEQSKRAASGPRFTIGNPDQDVVHVLLRVFGKDIEIASFVENAGILQAQIRVLACRVRRCSLDQLFVGKLGLRIFVQTFQIRVRGRRVEIVIESL